MTSFWDLLPASLLGQPPASGWPYADPLDAYSPLLPARDADSSKTAAPSSDSAPATSAQTRPLTFWDLLPATPHGQPFVPTMPPTRVDPWLSPTIGAAPVTPGARAFFPGADRPTAPGFLGRALGQSGASGDQSPPALQSAARPSDQRTSGITDVSGAAFTFDPLGPAPRSIAAPQSSGSEAVSDQVDPYSLLAATPARGKGLENPQRAASSAPTLPQLPDRIFIPSLGVVPTSLSGLQGELDSLLAPMNELHAMMQPPLRPPPGAFVDQSNGHVWIDDEKGGSHLWENVDPDAAYAYYADQQRRADFAPRFALNLVERGAGLTPRGALGMAGGRLTRPPTKVVNRLQNGGALDAAAPAAASRQASGPADTAEPSPLARPVPTEQIHHGISKKIHNALEKHLGLNGLYRYKDRRFETRAIDSDAHRGYQKWHRDLDAEIASHIRENPLMTQEKFEGYLRGRYAEPDLRARFRSGF